ncbi:MAG: amidohydrolase family protein [Anaerolineales bacterium]|nr:amidohydrolase family protein [Chloroflexota bacterium]MBL6981978.1 amidohydrolase family protein [Anaerolineales bacterium]
MTNKIDVLIKNCQLRGQPEKRYDIGISGGKITALDENLTADAQTVIDAQGNLVSEAFVNTHLHLCKVYTLPMMDELAMKDYHGADMGKAMTAIELAARVKESYDESWIIKNVRKAVALSAIYGGTHIRAFADVDSKAKLIGVKALIRAREEFKDIVDIQVVAFAQDGIVREPGAADLVRQAMELGADVVGGIPWIEFTDADIAEHVKVCYDIAEEFDKPVSMLVDDAGDPGLRSLELMALETINRGWHGRSLAHHARAMSMYPKPYLQKLAALLKKAEMGVVSDPHTGPLHARVRELLEEGVLVCLGMDDISDAYYPYGRNNMLEVAFLVSHLLWMTTRQDMETLYDMVTTKAAQCIGLTNFEIKVGSPANVVVLDEPNVLEALRNHAAPDYVISHGKLIDQDKMQAIVKTQEWPA